MPGKIFLSGEYGNAVEHHIHRRLISFFYHPPKGGRLTPDKHLQGHFDRGSEIFLDSGAFSAFTQNKKIDIELLTDFVIAHQDKLDHAACLDVIGDAEASYKNWQKQRQAGANVFPSFHYGEPFEFLDTIVAESDLIGLGGVAQLGTGPQLYEWLDAAWEHIIDANGVPKVKVHGFALTSIDVLRRYPWTLVDSASWAYAGAMGKVVFFDGKKLIPVAMTERNPDAEDIKARHWIHLNDAEKRVLEEFANSLGITMEGCIEHQDPRGIFNAATYTSLEALIPEKIGSRQQTLF